MKKQILSLVATLAILIPLSIVGFAGLTARVKVNIPFDFQVGGKQFQAGKYTVERFYTSGTLIIRSADNSSAANFNVVNVTDKGEQGARLVFHRYGNQHFLAQVYDGLSNEGQALTKSKAEREASKKRDIITQTIVVPEIKTIVAQVGQ